MCAVMTKETCNGKKPHTMPSFGNYWTMTILCAFFLVLIGFGSCINYRPEAAPEREAGESVVSSPSEIEPISTQSQPDKKTPEHETEREEHFPVDTFVLPNNCYPRIDKGYPLHNSFLCRCDDSQCSSNQRCFYIHPHTEKRFCFKEANERCNESAECYSSWCHQGLCKKSSSGEWCDVDADCEKGKCMTDGSSWSGKSCSCEQDSDCRTSFCHNDTCLSVRECEQKQRDICQVKAYGDKIPPCTCNNCKCGPNQDVSCTLISCPIITLWIPE